MTKVLFISFIMVYNVQDLVYVEFFFLYFLFLFVAKYIELFFIMTSFKFAPIYLNINQSVYKYTCLVK